MLEAKYMSSRAKEVVKSKGIKNVVEFAGINDHKNVNDYDPYLDSDYDVLVVKTRRGDKFKITAHDYWMTENGLR